MRNPDGTLNGDLNDNIPAYVSGTIGRVNLSTTNENETVYDLLPVFINKPPVIINPISEASTPPIKPYATANATGDAMYLFPDGTVKVKVGATFTFRLRAEQPSIFNVENGIPTMLPPNQGLKFVWRKDGNIVTSYTNNTLQSVLTVSNNELTFTNIQPEHAGSYICEVQNDIGTTSSETINLEILNLDFDEYFYRNLVKNPYGKDGTDEWEASSEDFISKQFTDVPSQELKRPNRIDLFGYTHDMMHPRPYQIDYGVLKGFNMTDALVLDKGTYFATDRFRFAERGGTSLVRAFQDIDLTDIQPLIKGGVFGVEGVRAIFSCYIGNAISEYIPVEEIVNLSLRTNPKYYSLRDPRLSVENTLLAGPPSGLKQHVEVYVEEYDNDTKLSSKLLYYTPQGDPQTVIRPDRIILRDPWMGNNGDLWKWLNENYKAYPDAAASAFVGLQSLYPTDVYGVGPCNDQFLNLTLMRARELVPNRSEIFTYGQYISFNKVVLERLNPKTTKVRITLSFTHEDGRIFDAWRDGFNSSDEVFEAGKWSFPHKRNTWLNTWNYNQSTALGLPYMLAIQDKRSGGKDLKQYMKSAEDPRGLVTAINFALLPVLTQDTDTTTQQTNSVFAINNIPAAFVPDVLGAFGRPFDPTGARTNRLKVYFSFSSVLQTDATGLLVNSDQLIVSFDALYPNTQGATPVQATPNGLFPFIDRSTVMVESINDLDTLQVSEPDNVKKEALKRYTKYRYLPQYNQPNTINSVLPNYTQSFNSASLDMTRYGYILDSGDVRIPPPILDVGVEWRGKSRFYGAFALYGTGSNTSVISTMLLNNRSPNLPEYDYTPGTTEERANTFTIIGYYMDFDFSNPNDTKVRFWRDKRNTYPPEESYSQLNPTRSFEIPHVIDQQGRLICTLSGSIITTPMSNGGMGYKLIKDILDPDIVNRTGVISGTDESGTGVRGNGKAVISVSGTPKDCITSLKVNIKPYSLPSDITKNAYYTRLVDEIIQPIETEINRITQIVQPQATDILRRSDLRTLTGSLQDYAYDTSNPTSINDTLNNEFRSTLVIDLTEEAFTNRNTFNSLYSYVSGNSVIYTRRQTLFPPHLLNLRANASASSISMIAMRTVDPLLFNDNIGSPSYGKFENNEDYVVVYAPLRDTVAGTYL